MSGFIRAFTSFIQIAKSKIAQCAAFMFDDIQSNSAQKTA
jgi:hypothetical protein